MKVRHAVNMKLDGLEVETSDAVQDLGVTLDSKLQFDQQITNTIQSSYGHSQEFNIRTILVHELIVARLDYCNVVL